MSATRVVVTGSGSIGPHGAGTEALAAALSAGRPLASAVDRAAGYHLDASARRAALVPRVDLARWLPPAQARRLGMPSRWAVAAARMAVEDARIATFEGRRVCVVLATAFGAVLLTEKLVRQILDEGPEAAQPFYFSECVANAAAAQLAIALGARGSNVTITQHQAGPLLALARGAHEVREGRADVAIVGSADEMTPLLHALLDRYGALASPRATLDEAPRPFDASRDGMLAGEGSAVLVLEREDDAAARGRPPAARVAASGAAFDPTATASDWGTGHAALGRALRETLARADLAPDDIDRVVSGASGARRGDRLEALSLRAAWGARPLPPILVPKAVVGEYGGGILAAGVLSSTGSPFGRVATFERADPELGIVPHDGSPLAMPRRTLLTSLASGGSAAWVVLERP